MIRSIIGIVVVVGIFLLAITNYLYIDDIAHCGGAPGIEKKCEEAGAIVALSGGDTDARTNEAIDLYLNGWAPIIVFSGAASDKTGPSNARVMRDTAIERGVPTEAIRIDEVSETTKENARESRTIFEIEKIDSVIVVTSGYHTRRAVGEFESREGITVRGHAVANDAHWSRYGWGFSTRGWYLTMSELGKNIYIMLGGSR